MVLLSKVPSLVDKTKETTGTPFMLFLPESPPDALALLIPLTRLGLPKPKSLSGEHFPPGSIVQTTSS